MTLRRREGKRVRLNGAALPSAEQLRSELTTLVFTPDRLAVVKGGPAVRRAYVDRSLARLAAGPRVAAGQVRRRALAPERRAAPRGCRRRRARRPRPVDGAGRRARRRAGRCPRGSARAAGGAVRRACRRAGARRCGASLRGRAADGRRACGARVARSRARVHDGRAPPRRRRDPGRLRATCGSSARRASSASPSSRCCSPRRRCSPSAARPPLLLLDDVLSELDTGRRRALAERLATGGQTIVTATAAGALPVEPALVVEVSPGKAVTA